MQQNKKKLIGVDDRIPLLPARVESANKIKCNSYKMMFNDSARKKTSGRKELLWWNNFSLATVYLLPTSDALLKSHIPSRSWYHTFRHHISLSPPPFLLSLVYVNLNCIHILIRIKLRLIFYRFLLPDLVSYTQFSCVYRFNQLALAQFSRRHYNGINQISPIKYSPLQWYPPLYPISVFEMYFSPSYIK